MRYYDTIRDKNHKFSLRLAMVLHARTHGIRSARREFGCSRNTVRTWVRRFENEGGRKALVERCRAPRSCPHKTSPHQEKKILQAREQVPCFGPRRLKDSFGLKPSIGAIARVLRQHGLTRRLRKKHEKKNDLRAVKARYRPLERLQADTKPLYDIAAFWPQMRALGLPKHQYTHRDVKSGALFIDYANELSTTYARLSTERLLAHFKDARIDLDSMRLSTDNGSEYGGAERTERQHGYHALIETWGIEHRFNPPATPNAHADVESSHALIERELFDLEPFRSRRDFFEKVATYQRWFNFARTNYHKGGRTPAQILEQEGVDPRVLLLDPLDLDRYFRNRSPTSGVGQVLPVLPVFSRRSDPTQRDTAQSVRSSEKRQGVVFRDESAEFRAQITH